MYHKTTTAILMLIIVNSLHAQRNFRINKKEYFTVSSSIDPTSSFKEKGLDFVGEIEYVGQIYTKVGVEYFSALTGGYRDIHAGMGVNFTSGLYEKTRFYAGVRTAKVNRGGEGAFRVIYGLEGGIDHTISDHMFIGLRATLDKRTDQEIFGWQPELKFSGFIRIGYRWDYKKR